MEMTPGQAEVVANQKMLSPGSSSIKALAGKFSQAQSDSDDEAGDDDGIKLQADTSFESTGDGENSLDTFGDDETSIFDFF